MKNRKKPKRKLIIRQPSFHAKVISDPVSKKPKNVKTSANKIMTENL